MAMPTGGFKSLEVLTAKSLSQRHRVFQLLFRLERAQTIFCVAVFEVQGRKHVVVSHGCEKKKKLEEWNDVKEES